ncbi:hypothetical protein R4Z09_17615 [Niallia oryzisoli]|uniref:Uncharacterized protein n=1 Tax=Niallia oryzisoli TaxID=1737571 RepID=A0ABZ2C6M2_9BACI
MYYIQYPILVSPYCYPPGIVNIPVRCIPAYIQAPLQSSHQIQPQRQYQYPEVDIQQFEKSAQSFQQLIKQADLLINRLARSKEFARELMSAAQKSDDKKVNELIKSTGITIKVKTSFTPDGIRIILDNSKLEGHCCQLLIALRW